MRDDRGGSSASIVIPAHNEEFSIVRLLKGILADAALGEFEIIVVCNGCSDRTAELARAVPGVRVIEMSEPSKFLALRRGDAAATSLPRVYLDADLELDTKSIRLLVDAVKQPGISAAAPERILKMDGASRTVRSYYHIWKRLPQVSSSLFGRGVVALSASGVSRVLHVPALMSDDLAVSEAFEARQVRVIEEAHVTIRVPTSISDLIRRRVRVVTGISQFDRAAGRREGSATTVGTLLRLVRDEPTNGVHLPAFLVVTAIAKLRARPRIRNADFSTWERDESSRRQ